MKKLIKKISKFLDLPGVNIALGIYCILGSFVWLLTEERCFWIWFGGFAFSFGLWLIIDGIDFLIDKKKKAADQEKTGH